MDGPIRSTEPLIEGALNLVHTISDDRVRDLQMAWWLHIFHAEMQIHRTWKFRVNTGFEILHFVCRGHSIGQLQNTTMVLRNVAQSLWAKLNDNVGDFTLEGMHVPQMGKLCEWAFNQSCRASRSKMSPFLWTHQWRQVARESLPYETSQLNYLFKFIHSNIIHNEGFQSSNYFGKGVLTQN